MPAGSASGTRARIAVGERGIERAVGEVGQFAGYPQQRESARQVAHRQCDGERQFLAPQSPRGVVMLRARGLCPLHRSLAVAARETVCQFGKPVERAGKIRCMAARALERAAPIPDHASRRHAASKSRCARA